MYLLDTNIISELRKPKPHGAVVAWLKALGEHEIFLSAVTLGEIQAGIERTRRTDPGKAADLEAWLDQLASSYQVLDMDGRAFREWARLMEGNPKRLIEDAMIAATACVHQLTVATRNIRDFQDFGVPLVNPFEGTSRLSPFC